MNKKGEDADLLAGIVIASSEPDHKSIDKMLLDEDDGNNDDEDEMLV